MSNEGEQYVDLFKNILKEFDQGMSDERLKSLENQHISHIWTVAEYAETALAQGLIIKEKLEIKLFTKLTPTPLS
jgi:hypothetical protein